MRPATILMAIMVVPIIMIGSSIPAAAADLGATVPSSSRPNIKRALPGAAVLIDAGHGGIDGGTHWGDIKESHINLAISAKLYLLLRSRGIPAILNRTGDYALSDDNRWHRTRSRHRRDLTQRKGLSEAVETRLFVSIHVNWSARGEQRGPLVIYREGDMHSAWLAAVLQEHLNHAFAINRKPYSSKRYYLLNQLKTPGVIVETAFLSHAQDRAVLTSARGQTMIAEAIAAGIADYLTLAP